MTTQRERPTCRDCSEAHGWCRKCGEVLRCNDHSEIPHEREDLTGQCMGHTPKRVREREYHAHRLAQTQAQTKELFV